MGPVLIGILGLAATVLLWMGNGDELERSIGTAPGGNTVQSGAVPGELGSSVRSDQMPLDVSEKEPPGVPNAIGSVTERPRKGAASRLPAAGSDSDADRSPARMTISHDGIPDETAIGPASALILDSAGLARLGVAFGRDEVSFLQVNRTDPTTLRPMSPSELPIFQYSKLNFGVGGFGSRRGSDVSEANLRIAPVLVTMQNRVEGRSESGGAFPELRSPFIDTVISRFSLTPRTGELEQVPEEVLKRLVPVHVQFAVPPRGATTQNDIASVTLWYAPTDAFLTAIPSTARATIGRELDALGSSPENCATGRDDSAILGACRRNSDAVRGLSAQSSMTSDEALVSFALDRERRVRIELYDRWGGFTRKLAEASLGSGSQSVLVNLDGVRRGEYQIVALTDDGDTAVATFVHQSKRRADPEEELRRRRAEADAKAAALGLAEAVRTPAMLDLTPPELARLGVDLAGDTLRVTMFGRIDGTENAAVRQRYGSAGYDPRDTTARLRFAIVAHPAGAVSNLLPYDPAAGQELFPVAVRNSWETPGAGSGINTFSPIPPPMDGVSTMEVLEEISAVVGAAASMDGAEIAQHWSRRLVPVTIHLADPPSNSRSARAKVTLWYVASTEFAAVLPERYRNQLLLELAALRRIEARETTPDEACRELPGGATFLDLCGLAVGAISAASVSPNPVRESATCSFTLAEAREVTIALHDLSGRLLRVLHKDERKAGDHSVALQFNDVESGSYLISVRTKDREQVVMRVVVI